MTSETMKTEANNLVARGKELVAEGSQRQLVFRTKAGRTLVEPTLTLTVAVAAFLLITGFISMPFIVIAMVVGLVMGIQVEVRHNDTVSHLES